MIRVAIDLVTHETGSAGRRLYTLEVVNDGTGTPDVGNYDVALSDGEGKAIDGIKMRDWPRQIHAWAMLGRIVTLFSLKGGA